MIPSANTIHKNHSLSSLSSLSLTIFNSMTNLVIELLLILVFFRLDIHLLQKLFLNIKTAVRKICLRVLILDFRFG